MCKKIYLDSPNVGVQEKEYVNNAIDAGYVSTAGPFVSEFEERFALYLGAKAAVSTQSGTAALHMALYELKIRAGDEVIVPAATFVATVNPVVYTGATPVFADVDRRTWNISPSEIKKNVNRKTKAIIPVHFYGNPCDMDEILEIAKEHNLYVIEDAAESLGAQYKGRHTGTFGIFGCFSFNGNKIITTGGGGMVVGNDTERLKHIKFLVNQAKDEKEEYYHPEIGFNKRMTNIESALGLAQMNRLSEFLRKKKLFNSIYRKELEGITGIRFQEEHEGARSSRWLTCIVFEEKIDVKKLQKRLEEKGIPTRRIFMPVVEFPPYRRYKKYDYKNCYEIYEKGLCLPSSTVNSESDIYYVCETLKQAIF
ncbi:MAG: LegC family aminotransferase [Omnitrophica bacterium]|nr:LegC family aminotransferase [Candidatus Omnitrophota bacterium]